MNRQLCLGIVTPFLLSMVIAQKSSIAKPSNEHHEKVTWAPGSFPIFEPKKEWTKPKVMVSSLKAAGLSIELDRADIKEYAKRYGAKLGQSGDAASFAQWLCFVGGQEDQQWALWLTSGEIDGDQISDFAIKQVAANSEVDSRCKPLGSPEEPSTSPSSLRLGMSESDLRLVLGEPTARRKDFLYYAHSHDIKKNNDPYTVMNTITIELKDGKVVAFKVWKSTQS